MVNRKWIYLFLLLLIVGIRFYFLDINENNYYWDEVVFLHLAENINEGNYKSSIGEEFRPPLFPFFLSFFTGYEHELMFILVILGMLALYFLGKEVFNKEVGYISAIIIGCMPWHFFYSFKLLAEPLAMIFMILAMMFAYKYEKNHKYELYLCALFMGLAVITKYQSVIIAFVIFGYFLFKGKIKDNLIAGGIFLLSISPIFILGYLNYGNFLGMLLSNFFENTTPHGGFFYYFIYFFPTVGIFLFFMFIYGLKSKEDKRLLILFLIAYFLFLQIVSQKYERFLILLFPFLGVIAGAGIYRLIKRFKIGNIVFIFWVVISLCLGVYMIEKDRENTKLLVETARTLEIDGKIWSTSPSYFLYFGGLDVVYNPDLEIVEDFDYFIIDNYHAPSDMTYQTFEKYIKENKKLLYNFTNEHREIIVYG